MERRITSTRAFAVTLAVGGLLVFFLRASLNDTERSASPKPPLTVQERARLLHGTQPLQQMLPAMGCTSMGAQALASNVKFEGYPEADQHTINVRAQNVRLPTELSGKLRAAADYSFAQWRRWLGRENLAPTTINLWFIGDAERFNSLYGQPKKSEFSTIGFYRTRSNSAFVLYAPPYKSAALGNAFHELSHLLSAHHLGPTPPWLNEGIAEHFETMRFRDEGIQTGRSREHLQLLYREGLVPLQELIGLSRAQWAESDALRRYASAWALIAFLMDTAKGEATLAGVLRAKHAARCEPTFEPQEQLERYPGGSAELERDWRRWLNNQFGRVS